MAPGVSSLALATSVAAMLGLAGWHGSTGHWPLQNPLQAEGQAKVAAANDPSSPLRTPTFDLQSEAAVAMPREEASRNEVQQVEDHPAEEPRKDQQREEQKDDLKDEQKDEQKGDDLWQEEHRVNEQVQSLPAGQAGLAVSDSVESCMWGGNLAEEERMTEVRKLLMAFGVEVSEQWFVFALLALPFLLLELFVALFVIRCLCRRRKPTATEPATGAPADGVKEMEPDLSERTSAGSTVGSTVNGRGDVLEQPVAQPEQHEELLAAEDASVVTDVAPESLPVVPEVVPELVPALAVEHAAVEADAVSESLSVVPVVHPIAEGIEEEERGDDNAADIGGKEDQEGETAASAVEPCQELSFSHGLTKEADEQPAEAPEAQEIIEAEEATDAEETIAAEEGTEAQEATEAEEATEVEEATEATEAEETAAVADAATGYEEGEEDAEVPSFLNAATALQDATDQTMLMEQSTAGSEEALTGPVEQTGPTGAESTAKAGLVEADLEEECVAAASPCGGA